MLGTNVLEAGAVMGIASRIQLRRVRVWLLVWQLLPMMGCGESSAGGMADTQSESATDAADGSTAPEQSSVDAGAVGSGSNAWQSPGAGESSAQEEESRPAEDGAEELAQADLEQDAGAADPLAVEARDSGVEDEPGAQDGGPDEDAQIIGAEQDSGLGQDSGVAEEQDPEDGGVAEEQVDAQVDGGDDEPGDASTEEEEAGELQTLRLITAGTFAGGRCSFSDCAADGWTTETDEGVVRTSCLFGDCLEDGWRTVFPDGTTANTRCRFSNCFEDGWETTLEDVSATTRCLFNDCAQDGWSTGLPDGSTADTRCNFNDCLEQGWQTTLPSQTVIACRCSFQDCLTNGADCN